jgi:hypothetical protein
MERANLEYILIFRAKEPNFNNSLECSSLVLDCWVYDATWGNIQQ